MRSQSANSFSLAEARAIVANHFTPVPVVYWTDFLLTIGGFYLFASLTRFAPQLVGPDWTGTALRVACFIVSGLLAYRAAMFIHELVHLPSRTFKAFRFAWNLLCGIPFLMPTFVYYTHLDHHRRRHFGTEHDGEYITLEKRGWQSIVFYLAVCPLVPIAAWIRFSLLTPLTWFHSSIRKWVHQHASSMVMDPTYLRPLPTQETLRAIRWQELGCFAFCWSIPLVAFFLERWPIPFFVQAYCTAVFVVTLNSVRTLGSHRWWNDGRELTFLEQMLDSVTVVGQPWISELWGPVGTRFHSLHHLFPSLPYHNMAEAHRRLMAELPADSPYRRTVAPSLSAALADLWRRSRHVQKPKPQQRSRPTALSGREAAA